MRLVMSHEPLPVYRHSGKFGLHGPLVALFAAVVIGFPLGFAYAYGMKWIPFIYINFVLTTCYALAFGFSIGFIMKWAKVRNTFVAFLCGLIGGLLAMYFNWNAHVHALFDGAAAVNPPRIILGSMKFLYEHGSWGLRHSGNVTGIPLVIIWVIEAGIIVAIAALLPMAMVYDTPFCEKNQIGRASCRERV